ncbi:MAG: DUF4249 family protein [Calditrichia bacterium]|nr:DUF4249 family protein [Calditrichia bacterium]
MINRLIILLITVLLIASCGNPSIKIEDDQYKPKIVINGYIFPHKPVDKIFITRNFPVDQNIDNYQIIPPDTRVSITDVETGTSYSLSFHVTNDSAWFRYEGSGLDIDYGKSYRLDVTATIDGKALQASSVTTVPQQGFEIISINYDSLHYYEKDESDNIISFNVEFERSPGTTFYLATIQPVDTSYQNFIYDNAFGDLDSSDVKENYKDFTYNYTWIQDTPLTPGQSNVDLFWFFIWYYGKYQAVIYAADENYRYFMQTYSEVREMDGNYHEPIMNIEGDGIGIFASMIADTVEFFVTP